jgi:hypothetical protein
MEIHRAIDQRGGAPLETWLLDIAAKPAGERQFGNVEESQDSYGNNSIVTLQKWILRNFFFFTIHCLFGDLHPERNFISLGMDLALEDPADVLKQRNMKYGQLVEMQNCQAPDDDPLLQG